MKRRKRGREGGKEEGRRETTEKQLKKKFQCRKSLMINWLIKDQSWESICGRNADIAFC